MALSAGRRLGPYEIRALIGTGGMGEVYEAHDTRLQRRVAIKTLRPELLAEPRARRRFEQEARLLSSFTHPNICTVFDVGQQDGIDFLVLEFIEGRTLSALLHQESLDESTVIKYAAQIAEAVAEAHEHGVLHRDIKPQNVMVTARGQTKVLDFGLARTLDTPADGLTVTDTSGSGQMIGTAAYMSPEQVRGEQLDTRSDAFSFGCLLYEAIAGHPPFQASTVGGTLSAILTAEPVPLARVASNTSPELQRIVRKCLEKDKSRRYQTLRDVSTDLENIRRQSSDSVSSGPGGWDVTIRPRGLLLKVAGTAAAVAVVALLAAAVWSRTGPGNGQQIGSLAILPFTPLTSIASENYLGLGLADALISRLSGAPRLAVRPTSAVRRYTGEDADALKAGRDLQVDAVVDGTWQRDNDRLRISVNLLRVDDGVSLWTESFDMSVTDIFAVQDRVSERLAARLRLELDSRSGPERLNRPGGTTNPEAYDAYLRGIYYLGSRGYDPAERQNTDRAIDFLERAVAIDPGFAEAHAKLGFGYAHTAVFAEDNPALIVRAKQETEIAERLEPGLGQVHLNRGMILWTWYEGWRIVDSIREYRRAEQLDPSLTDIELNAGYAHLGLVDDWRRVGTRSVERDPTNRQARVVFVNEHFLLNLAEEGLTAQKQMLKEGPDERYFLLRRQIAEAAPLVERRMTESPNDPFANADLALLRALQGRHGEAQGAATRALQVLKWKNRSYHHLTYTFARVHALGGNPVETARWLQETIDWGNPCYPMFSTDTFLDAVRNAAPVQKVLGDLRLRWEQYREALR